MPSNHPLISVDKIPLMGLAADNNSRGASWELRLGFPTLARFYCEYPNRNFVAFNRNTMINKKILTALRTSEIFPIIIAAPEIVLL